MSPVAFLAKSSRTSLSRPLFLLLALTLCCSGAASANTVWFPGDVITCGQADWAAGCGALLGADFFTVYATSVTVGLPSPGFALIFAGTSFVVAYLPAAGAAAPRDAPPYTPPQTTPRAT